MFVLSVIILLAFMTQIFGQSIGDNCHIEAQNNKSGICVLLNDCPSVLVDILNQRFPQTCGFQGTVPIVCCTIKKTTAVTPGELAREKCTEYGKAVYQLVKPPTLDINVQAINISICGLMNDQLSIGSIKATSGEFPHMAALGYGEESNKLWACSGSLISEQFVLTAAHCLHSRSLGPVRWIRLGAINTKLNTDSTEPEEFSVIEMIKHPEYKPTSFYNDIGLLKMNRPVKFNKNIRPTCLQTTTLNPSVRYLAPYWDLQNGYGSASGDLLKLKINSVSAEKCSSIYQKILGTNRKYKNGILPFSQMCAGGPNEDKERFQSDSGAPIHIYNNDVFCMYNVVGVSSFKPITGLFDVPGIYTRVSNYIEWIEKTVWS